MTATRRSTPCVGICSTTYGDLVCRGCKRFAHEIVSWNAFDAQQRGAIWGRLEELRKGAISRCLRVLDEDTFQRGRHNPAEGGPKGIDVDVRSRVLAATCEEMPLAFFDLRPMLDAA